MIDLTPIMEAIIALVVAVITAFVIPWLKGKIDADKLEQIKLWVTVAVEAAEQLYNGTGRGEEKKAYVVKFLQEKGFTIDPDSLDKLIEAAVFNLPEFFVGFKYDKRYGLLHYKLCFRRRRNCQS